MLEKIIHFDKQLLVFLNNLGSETYDGFWLIITKQIYWTPFFLLIFYFIQKKIGWKNFSFYLLFTAFIIIICDQTSNFFKDYFQRLRPCNDEEINHLLRLYWKKSKSFSFFSGHAANSMGTTVFCYFLLRNYYKHTHLLFLFPLIFAYSRIYLGLHFPADIVTGYFFGSIVGIIFYKLYTKFVIRNS